MGVSKKNGEYKNGKRFWGYDENFYGCVIHFTLMVQLDLVKPVLLYQKMKKILDFNEGGDVNTGH